VNLSAPFISRPIATSLLAIGIALAGITAFNFLPVASLPTMDFPTIVVSTSFPGASPEVMSTSIITPLEKQIGRISGISELTSASNSGSAQIVVMFDLDRDINGAARDVQAAINASLGQMPAGMPSNPTYRKVNPADAPILIMTLTSKTYDVSNMYDFASTILQQQLSKVDGVGQVEIGGSSLPAIRITLNPTALNKYNLDFQNVANIVASANINGPCGQLANNLQTSDIVISNGQLFEVNDYKSLILSYSNGAAVRLEDVADISKSVEDVLNIGLCNNQAAVVLIIFKEPGANVIKTVDNIKNILPIMRDSIPGEVDLNIILDRTTTIRASLYEVEKALIFAILLVIAVVYIFLGNVRAALVPSVAVPLSLCGTFAIMYLLGYSLDNLSLIALTIVTGFVVDDAVVVLENISRHIDQGMKQLQAAMLGALEVGFTVLSMSLSLIAVFIPILLMGGIVGRLFREFAVTLAVAIVVSLIISLTVTPMMCAKLLRKQDELKSNKLLNKMQMFYGKTLNMALNNPRTILGLFVLSLLLSVFMYIKIPKGFFPLQDTGGIVCSIQSDQNMSFKELEKKLRAYIELSNEDPAVANAVGFAGDNSSGFMFLTLKPLEERKVSAQAVIDRLREKTAVISGANLYMQVPQDIVIGGRHSSSQFQYTLSSSSMDLLREWSPKVMAELSNIPGIVDVNSDQRDNGLQAYVNIDHDAAANFGITMQQIDQQLFGAFGQQQVATLFTARTQSHIIMTVADKYWLTPKGLDNIYITSQTGMMVPLQSVANFEVLERPLSINHQSQFPSITFSFNLASDFAIGNAVSAVDHSIKTMGLPSSVSGSFRGTAQAFQASLANEVLLLLAAIFVVYLVLGILYENLIHPLTILSTLPSAGLGALLALYFSNVELTVIAIVGILLLIGIVKKNAIMMIDFAIYIRTSANKSAREAIYEAALLRLRPIMMTTLAALLGAVPLVLAGGIGYELRRPLGITIIGGLVLSQMLTLYTTPVIYLMLEKLGINCQQRWHSLWSKHEKIYINH
jgi:multidrug efflux pump